MAKRHFLANRLKAKTQLFRFITRLNTHYNLSLAAAEMLSNEILDEIANSHKESLSDGQMWYTAVHKDEPAGKPLLKCRKVRIKLTLHHPDDVECQDTHSLKSQLVHRLCWEAIEQNALLTIEDLSIILFTSERTIRRIISEFRSQELFIPIRGYYHDIGPGTSHKSQAIRLFLKGFSVSKIAQFLGHHIQSIERYLDDFCIVMMGIEDGFSAARIARNSKISERLVKEYQSLYLIFKDDPAYQSVLAQLKIRLAHLLKKNNKQEAAR